MKKSISIIGSGPSALMLASKLDPQKFDVRIYEKNQAPARKFLVAGQGGFNLTHSEPLEQLIHRYIPASFFEPVLRSFSNTDLRNWLETIGIPTYIGSSKRVFPKEGIKPIEVLNSILEKLKTNHVKILCNHEWLGWGNSGQEHQNHSGQAQQNHSLIKIGLQFKSNTQIIDVQTDMVILALGGGSWKITGSDGSWTKHFEAKGIKTLPFQASNCAIRSDWANGVLEQYEGQAIKNCSFSCKGIQKPGEVVLTKTGMEGGAIYALIPQIRNQLNEQGNARLFIDLKPTLSLSGLIQRIKERPGRIPLTSFLEKELKLSKIKIALLKARTSKEEFNNTEILCARIKELPIKIIALTPIDEAISTVGGIPLSEIDANFQLRKLPHHYAIGEMLDWDAPTGGYLLQGCFSMGSMLAEHLNQVC
jgi:uncharacterized flavoprotein (TIGR03862 family)